MGGLIGGIIAVVLGVLVCIRSVFGFSFFDDFLIVLKGIIPPLLILGGLFAVYIGITDIKDRIEEKKAEKESATSQEASEKQE